jgi:hypothetical protein
MNARPEQGSFPEAKCNRTVQAGILSEKRRSAAIPSGRLVLLGGAGDSGAGVNPKMVIRKEVKKPWKKLRF